MPEIIEVKNKSDVTNLMALDSYWQKLHPKYLEIHKAVREWFLKQYPETKAGGCVTKKDSDVWSDLGQVLLVGEGNLSFANSLINYHDLPVKNITATIYETEKMLSDETRKNAQNLLDSGAVVRFGIDATRLDQAFVHSKFDTIVFQFPHVGSRQPKYRRNPNFVLLRRFLDRAKPLLKDGGKILVSVVENPYYKGIFQLVEAAEFAGFHSSNSYNFEPKDFPGYRHVNTNDNDSAINDHDRFVTWVLKVKK